jgi:hypothetical protein
LAKSIEFIDPINASIRHFESERLHSGWPDMNIFQDQCPIPPSKFIRPLPTGAMGWWR